MGHEKGQIRRSEVLLQLNEAGYKLHSTTINSRQKAQILIYTDTTKPEGLRTLVLVEQEGQCGTTFGIYKKMDVMTLLKEVTCQTTTLLKVPNVH